VPRHASSGEVGEGRKARRDVPEAGANRWRIFVEITVEGARFSEKCHLFASRRRRRDCKANKAGKGRQEPPREVRALRRIFIALVATRNTARTKRDSSLSSQTRA